MSISQLEKKKLSQTCPWGTGQEMTQGKGQSGGEQRGQAGQEKCWLASEMAETKKNAEGK